MTNGSQGSSEKVAWIAAALSLIASVMLVLAGFVGEPNAVTAAAAALTGIGGGLWLGRAVEARAVRAGRHMLRR